MQCDLLTQFVGLSLRMIILQSLIRSMVEVSDHLQQFLEKLSNTQSNNINIPTFLTISTHLKHQFIEHGAHHIDLLIEERFYRHLLIIQFLELLLNPSVQISDLPASLHELPHITLGMSMTNLLPKFIRYMYSLTSSLWNFFWLFLMKFSLTWRSLVKSERLLESRSP